MTMLGKAVRWTKWTYEGNVSTAHEFAGIVTAMDPVPCKSGNPGHRYLCLVHFRWTFDKGRWHTLREGFLQDNMASELTPLLDFVPPDAPMQDSYRGEGGIPA